MLFMLVGLYPLDHANEPSQRRTVTPTECIAIPIDPSIHLSTNLPSFPTSTHSIPPKDQHHSVGQVAAADFDFHTHTPRVAGRFAAVQEAVVLGVEAVGCTREEHTLVALTAEVDHIGSVRMRFE